MKRIGDSLSWLGAFSPGVCVVIALAVGSAVMIALHAGSSGEAGLTGWTFAKRHYEMYGPVIERWNGTHDEPVTFFLMNMPSLERRLVSGFLGGLPTADLIEVEARIASRAFAGPPETVGFIELSERLEREGMLSRINAPSFSPWTSRGRIYGIPHDVHPVLLCYRADIVEAAGIDVTRIETWDDFERVMRPLVADLDGDGDVDRYAISFWETNTDALAVLLLQAGGGFFDESGACIIDSEVNARVLARLVTWIEGPGRIAGDAPEFSAAGNKLKIDGFVVSAVMSDWLCNIWKHEMPQLEGTLKLMPLPAWEAGGRRTSAWGGTMIGIPRTTADPEAAWAFAKHLYLSEELAVELYREGDIITPIKDFWSNPVFAEPDPYFCGQAKGLMYIGQADDVPLRVPSAYANMALTKVQGALVDLKLYARRTGATDRDELRSEARRLLAEVHAFIESQMANNRFAGASP